MERRTSDADFNFDIGIGICFDLLSSAAATQVSCFAVSFASAWKMIKSFDRTPLMRFRQAGHSTSLKCWMLLAAHLSGSETHHQPARGASLNRFDSDSTRRTDCTDDDTLKIFFCRNRSGVVVVPPV